ncbi:hypothetical protein PsorP6_011737 [Peronosclerospora sorghi]|uniref:Uncharacterized protein n=1 Tax=Peronosclerospora sorghi TaxID=230839 RepID=A0ACC0WHR2_9STRA|nr:hypothetical protein PsorP6_011737 [Peronosclerospora sorghi]
MSPWRSSIKRRPRTIRYAGRARRRLVEKVSAATLLLQKGANPNAKDRDGRTPLHWAARNNHVDVVRLFLAYDAHPSATNEECLPVMCFAVEAEGVYASIFSHQSRRSDAPTQVAGGNTALHIALQLKNLQASLALIQCGSIMMITNEGASGRWILPLRRN